MNKYLRLIGEKSQKAFDCKINTKKKNKVLKNFAKLIKQNKIKILIQNNKDVIFAKKKELKQNT